MTIAQSATIQAYQLRNGGTPARMAILRMIAANSVSNRNPATRLQPGDWRGARRYTLKSYAAAYCSGINQCAGSWYSHGGEQFRNERDAGDVCATVRHNSGGGWYTDAYCDETARGIVARIPHGRFIAGYRWSCNNERVYFKEVFTDENDAARMADEHARIFAESAREDSERFDAMCEAEHDTEEKEQKFKLAFMARHVSADHAELARDALDELRSARDVLASATANYERG